LRIAIDAHSIGTKLGGNESYATNLIRALADVDRTNEYVLYVTTPEAVESFKDRWPNFQVHTTLPHTPLIRIPLTLSAELRRHPVDVLHVQFTAPPLCPCPVVVSVHDLSFEHLPETFKRRSRTQLRLTVRSSARRAAHVLTLSEHTRQDVAQTYGIPLESITAIPLAAPKHFGPVHNDKELQRVRHIYGIDGDYVLSVGSIQPRKNLSRLVRAFAALRNEQRNQSFPKLVLVGKCAWLFDETFQALRESGLGNEAIVTGYVPESDLPALYSGALCFVYPSIFEGFGLPPLEAMKCGTPVIVSNTTSLPEVVGDSGLQVDPFDVNSIASAIKKLLFDTDLRRELSARGQSRAQLFDWHDTARRTLAVYEEVVQAEKKGRPVR
jgi:glycosyltransferase involved in cell wall biosynthesis